ncbi:MAG: gephyrin-like molybdotransferase Glp, partial [Candidatus Bathyarchaeia archaeon]
MGSISLGTAPEVRRIGFKKSIPVDEAIEKFLGREFPHVGYEIIETVNAINRVLAEEVKAKVNVPNFNRSAVDGYALRAEETFGAGSENPVAFKLVGKIEAGQIFTRSIGQKECVEIATGGVLPLGADSVVMLEFVDRRNDEINVLKSTYPLQNVARVGEDVKKGEVVLSAGRVIRAQDIGLLASIGVKNIRVLRKPKVAVIPTGSELVEPFSDEDLRPGQIVNTNRLVICNLVKEYGGQPLDYGLVSDDLDAIRASLKRALVEADIVVVTGGASVGSKDLVPAAINSLGKPGMLIHGVAMRPGQPVGLAVVRGKPVLSLPGFPVATILAFDIFGRPLIRKMGGFPNEMRLTVKARLKRRVASKLGFRSFARVRITKSDEGYVA